MANCVSKDDCLQLAEIFLSETKYLGIWCRDRVTGYAKGGGGQMGEGQMGCRVGAVFSMIKIIYALYATVI